jgi:peptidoglycan/LPS O-acetylase OafA/YrhL
VTKLFLKEKVVNYRKDIQVLRGISVLLVVIFHLELGVFQSGYLGVDIFFVISGFLMALLYNKNEKLIFFARRAKRLLPAYFVVVLVTLLASFIIVLPHEFNDVTGQALWATIFSSNIGFWSAASYFSKAEFKPLLHLWSLGVEIQFYLLVPLLFWFCRLQKSLVFVSCIISLICCFYILGISPKTSFFITPFRFWEFLLGYIVAKYFTDNGNVKYKSNGLFSVLILCSLLIIPVFKTDGDALSWIIGHPGLISVLVSCVTALFLIFGLSKQIVNSKIASAMERLGEYSYSIYLTHFPIILFYNYYPFKGSSFTQLSIVDFFVLVILITFATLALYHFVEVPLRKKVDNRLRKLLMPSIISLVVLFSISGTSFQTDNFSENELVILDSWTDRTEYRCGKLIRIIDPSATICELSNVNNPNKKILLVGNSHADSIKSYFSTVSERHNSSLFLTVSNATLGTSFMTPAYVLAQAKLNDIDTIVLHDKSQAKYGSSIEDLLILIKDTDINLFLIDPVPVYKEHIPESLWFNLQERKELPHQNIEEYERENERLFGRLEKINNPKFIRYKVGTLLCSPDCLLIDGDGIPYYFDDNHLTISGSKLLQPIFEDILNR